MSDVLQDPLARLPHGPEFRFIDRLTSLEPGKAGTGVYCVRGNEEFLKGHFPGEPLFPGVLLVEGMAQLAGVVAQCDPAIPPLQGLKLTAIRGVKILGSARPGEQIRFEAAIQARMANLIQAKASAWIDSIQIAVAELTLGGQA